MKFPRSTIITAILFYLLGINIRCSMEQLAGGSEIGNPTNATIFGKADYPTSGLPAAHANVRLRTKDFVAVPGSLAHAAGSSSYRNTTTDDSGSFIIRGVDTGTYCIEIIDDNASEEITPSSAVVFCAVSAGDSLIPLSTVTHLKTVGSLAGSYASLADPSATLGLLGIDRSATLNLASKTFSIPDLPEGAFTLYVASGSDHRFPNGNNPVTVRSNVTTKLNAIDLAPMSAWSASRRLTLNTTASGADISGNVYGFPVLVRLTSGNFDFARTKTDGGDIRFAKSDGTLLAHEIERWDAGNGAAEIWVKVDTVYGSGTQSLTMYWGNANAADNSNSAAVFDTGSGFQGVWHLNEAGSAIAKDATVNHYDGTPSDTAPTGAMGAIGPCRAFNGSSNGIRMNGTADSKLNFQENDSYTISAWVLADTLDNGYHMVAGKGNEQYFLGLKRSIPDTTMRWEFVEYHDKAGWNITEDFPSAKTWAHLVGVRKGTSQCLYVNGVLIDSSIFVSASNAPRYGGDDITIGKFITTPAYAFEGKCPFPGKIDEVRISNEACNADWIKLCYMNQKAQDALVRW